MYKVAIVITSYNLEEYIGQALESILEQQTNFDFKIIIGDDCSKDKTLEILQEYKKRYPDKIEIHTFENNKGSLSNSNRLFDGLQSEYFAFLDGDDYWVGKDRLQKQVDFLDSHPEYSICAGNTQYLKNGVLAEELVNKNLLGKTYTFEDYINGKIPFFHTSALLLRNKIFINGIPSCFKEVLGTFEECALRGEDFRRILHLEQGKLYALEDTVSIYRIHKNGLWQGSTNTRKILETAICWNFYAKYFKDKYGGFFTDEAKKSYQHLIDHLIIEKSMGIQYMLTSKDSFLLTGLLNDIASRNIESTKKTKHNRIIRKAFRAFITFFTK